MSLYEQTLQLMLGSKPVLNNYIDQHTSICWSSSSEKERKMFITLAWPYVETHSSLFRPYTFEKDFFITLTRSNTPAYFGLKNRKKFYNIDVSLSEQTLQLILWLSTESKKEFYSIDQLYWPTLQLISVHKHLRNFFTTWWPTGLGRWHNWISLT